MFIERVDEFLLRLGAESRERWCKNLNARALATRPWKLCIPNYPTVINVQQPSDRFGRLTSNQYPFGRLTSNQYPFGHFTAWMNNPPIILPPNAAAPSPRPSETALAALIRLEKIDNCIG